jgi:predicted lipid carrier protein YhbT
LARVALPLLSQLFRKPPQAILFAGAFNHAMRGQDLLERLAQLRGKRIRLHIEDVPLEMRFRVVAAGLRADSSGEPDVTIRGRLVDLWRIATRREDPDTLFFHRRLAIEGETETGLHVKNLLDALDYDFPAHLRAVLPAPVAELALQGFEHLRTRVSSLTGSASRRETHSGGARQEAIAVSAGQGGRRALRQRQV